MGSRKKIYVLDTNVLLADANACQSFKKEDIVIPFAVIEELDNFKKRMDSVGVNCRAVSRFLEGLRIKTGLYKGTKIGKNMGTLRVYGIHPENVPGLDQSIPDNKILATALELQKQHANNQVILVSRDINIRLKADAVGLPAEDYLTDRVAETSDDIYTGIVEEVVPKNLIDIIYASKEMEFKSSKVLYPNQFVLLKSEDNEKTTALTCFKNGKLRLLKNYKDGDIKPKNKEQQCALAALMDPEIKIVTLIGPAGTGKSILALYAGCQAVDEEQNHKLVITRPIEPVGKDLGYLPGILEEKLLPWMKPIYDNLELFLPNLEQYFDDGTIQIEPLTYIRGRSINNAFIILDEAQNISRHEIKTMMTRVGHNAKIVITGDIKQIDNVHVDEFSNGLTHAVEAFKNEELAAHITLTKGERSEVATLASRLL